MTEATQDAAKPARKKNAHYDVFMQVDTLHERPEWLLIGEDVGAPSRREAIVQAAAAWRLPDGSEVDPYGSFATVRHGEFQVLTRAKKTIVADDWGSA